MKRVETPPFPYKPVPSNLPDQPVTLVFLHYHPKFAELRCIENRSSSDRKIGMDYCGKNKLNGHP